MSTSAYSDYEHMTNLFSICLDNLAARKYSKNRYGHMPTKNKN
jgi:hypothetical protein